MISPDATSVATEVVPVTFRVAMFARVRTVMFVTFAVATFMVLTLVVERLEVPRTFRFVRPKIDAEFIVNILVVERLAVPKMFIAVLLNIVDTFRFVTFATDSTVILFTFPDSTFKEVTFVVERFEVPETLID